MASIYKTVDRLEYGKRFKEQIQTQKRAQLPEQQYFTLDIHFEDGTVCSVMNGDFTMQNPALQVMAYCGVTPSTIEKASGTEMPIVYNGRGVQLHRKVLNMGKEYLAQAAWGPQ